MDNIIPPESDYMPFNAPSLEQTPYTLGPGDVISIDIFNIPEYSKTYQVLIDGSINVPLINKVPVVGMTIPELQNLVTQMYAERRLLVDPIITINLVAPRPINVSVTGDIRNPGSYVVPFRRGENRDRAELGSVFPTLIDALKIAKGINASADEQRIQVIRTYKGTQRAYLVNLRQFLNQGDLAQDITLRDGDRIVVPSAESIDREAVLRRANADFSAELNVPVSINIVGEINRPGPYTLNADEVQSNLDDQLDLNSSERQTQTNNKFATISTAIRSAGGVTGKADLRNIEIRRTLPSGQKQTITAKGLA